VFILIWLLGLSLLWSMVVGYTTTYAISAYHHWCCEFASRSTLCDEVCQWLATGRLHKKWEKFQYFSRSLKPVQPHKVNCRMCNLNLFKSGQTKERPSWSYGSWIYNSLCNRCLSPLTLWVRILFIVRCTWYNIMR
jgi:hypothetical protein